MRFRYSSMFPSLGAWVSRLRLHLLSSNEMHPPDWSLVITNWRLIGCHYPPTGTGLLVVLHGYGYGYGLYGLGYGLGPLTQM